MTRLKSVPAKVEVSSLCERCHFHDESWFIDGGYVCTGCADEWSWWRWVARFMVAPWLAHASNPIPSAPLREG